MAVTVGFGVHPGTILAVAAALLGPLVVLMLVSMFWAVVAVILAVAASVPALWLLFQLGLDEWCEGQPGGRGYASISSPDEIPALCRW